MKYRNADSPSKIERVQATVPTSEGQNQMNHVLYSVPNPVRVERPTIDPARGNGVLCMLLR